MFIKYDTCIVKVYILFITFYLWLGLFLFVFFFTTPTILSTSVDEIRALLFNATHIPVSSSSGWSLYK